MSKLPETYIEILGFLNENKAGLKTSQILAIAQQKRCHGMSDTSKISSIIYHLRKKKLVTSSEAVGGHIHKITQIGAEILTDDGIGIVKKQDESTTCVDEVNLVDVGNFCGMELHNSLSLTKFNDENDVHPVTDIMDSFNNAMMVIHDVMISALTIQKPITISDKETKIQVLERLGPLYNDEISQVINDIRDDLKQL